MKHNNIAMHLFSRLQNLNHLEMIYGNHAVLAALENPKRICEYLFVKGENPEITLAAKSKRNLEVHIVDKGNFQKLLKEDEIAQNAILFSRPLASPNLAQFLVASADHSCCLILDQLEDPQNLGNILRTAAVFGVSAIVLPGSNSVPITRKVIKIASGAYEYVPLITISNISNAIDQLKKAGYWVIGLSEHSETRLNQINDWHKMPRVALVVGSESSGIRRLTKENCDMIVKLPTAEGPLVTLNAATATAVAVYEWRKNVQN